MIINRDNYENFFLLYVDGELCAADRKAVEDFAAENEDLQKELEILRLDSRRNVHAPHSQLPAGQ